MNSDSFKYIIQNQSNWASHYYANRKRKNVISVICNRKHKSKGNKDAQTIHNSLVEMGLLEDAIYLHKFSGDICHECLLGK